MVRHTGVRVSADLVWWDGLTAVDQNLQANINRLVGVAEVTKLTEVNAWADASRQKEQLDEEVVNARGRNALETGGHIACRGNYCQPPTLGGAMMMSFTLCHPLMMSFTQLGCNPLTRRRRLAYRWRTFRAAFRDSRKCKIH